MLPLHCKTRLLKIQCSWTSLDIDREQVDAPGDTVDDAAGLRWLNDAVGDGHQRRNRQCQLQDENRFGTLWLGNTREVASFSRTR